jgi:hypothetical protein
VLDKQVRQSSTAPYHDLTIDVRLGQCDTAAGRPASQRRRTPSRRVLTVGIADHDRVNGGAGDDSARVVAVRPVHRNAVGG